MLPGVRGYPSIPGSASTYPFMGVLGDASSQYGPVVRGPDLARSEAEATAPTYSLVRLTARESANVQNAKRFAMEQSIRVALASRAHTMPFTVNLPGAAYSSLTQSVALNVGPSATGINVTVSAGSASGSAALKRQQALLLLGRVYVGSICYEVSAEQVRGVFTPFGPIRSVSMTFDTTTQRHKGFAFVEFETPEASFLAIDQMNGYLLAGRPIKVGRPSNMAQSNELIDEMIREAESSTRIYVSSVHPDLSEVDLRSVFQVFGTIRTCSLPPDPLRPSRHRGFAYIDYETEQAARDAVASMNLFDLGGQLLRVARALPAPGTVSATTPVTAVGQPSSTVVPQAVAARAAAISARVLASEQKAPIGGIPSPTSAQISDATLPPPGVVVPQLGGVPAPLVGTSLTAAALTSGDVSGALKQEDAIVASLEREESGVRITGNEQRRAIMQRLLRASGADATRATGSSSRVVLLRNMVTPAELAEANADQLDEDVRDECAKFGVVERVRIARCAPADSSEQEDEVRIFVLFALESHAAAAIRNLDKRFFAGRLVSAEAYDQNAYDSDELGL